MCFVINIAFFIKKLIWMVTLLILKNPYLINFCSTIHIVNLTKNAVNFE